VWVALVRSWHACRTDTTYHTLRQEGPEAAVPTSEAGLRRGSRHPLCSVQMLHTSDQLPRPDEPPPFHRRTLRDACQTSNQYGIELEGTEDRRVATPFRAASWEKRSTACTRSTQSRYPRAGRRLRQQPKPFDRSGRSGS